MKKIYNLLLPVVLALFFFTSCDKDDRQLVELDKDVTISEFKILDIAGVINNEDMTIKLMLPPHTEVTQLITDIRTTDEHAEITPASGVPMNFTRPVEYTVTNGNVYNKYMVSVEVIKAQITSFVLDEKYQGIIDQTANKIMVAVPTNTDVTKMTPQIKYTEGAEISPKPGIAQDFTNSVIYTLTYMDNTFSYTIVVEERDESYAFIGTATNVDALQSLHEKNAAEWFLSTLPNSSYISFKDVKSGNIPLSSFDVIWFHNGTTHALPAEATDGTVVNKIKEYYQNGGSLLLTSFACLYVDNIGVSKNGGPNNVFGDAIAWTVPERWGVSFEDQATHPIFANLELADDRNYAAAYFIDKDVHRRNVGCLWHIEPAPYDKDKEKWTQLIGGIPLAALDWDPAGLNHVSIAEFPRIENKNGAVICIGAPSYEWYNEPISGTPSPENSYLQNIETITKNSIEYLKN